MFDMTSLPMVVIEETFHIGTMNKENADHTSSLEGDLVSTSLCPRSWSTLLRKSHSVNYYRLTKDNATFLDILTLLNDPVYEQVKEKLFCLAEKEGWLSLNQNVYRYTMLDDGDEEIYYDFLTLEDLIDELGEEAASEATLVSEFFPTQKLLDRYHGQNISAKTFGCLAVLQDLSCDFDGVFWDYNFDPLAYSLPVIAIFPEKLATWKIEKLNCYDDLPYHDNEINE